jgi:STAM-binding protein
MAGSSVQISRPMSVKEISAKAEDFDFNPSIALKYWIRTAHTLLREVYLSHSCTLENADQLKARIYEQEENDQQAFLLLMRYATLVAYKLPTHPSAREPEHRAGLRLVDKTLPRVLDQLEHLKLQIDARYDGWQKALERRGGSMAIESEGPNSETQFDLAASDPAVAGNTVTLGAAENSDLAVRLAHREIRRRETRRRATRQAGLSVEEEHERRTAGLWDDWESALTKNHQSRDDEMQQNMEDSKRRLDGPHGIVSDETKRFATKAPSRLARPAVQSRSSEYRYPSIQKSQPLQQDHTSGPPSRTSSPAVYVPPLPPKERLQAAVRNGPPTPPKMPVLDRPDSMSSPSTPPTTFTFRPSAYLESGKPLRTVFLPQNLRQKFLKVAEPNTRRNLETCGMLCGTLISNALFISKVVIPEQESTSDTCDTINESAFFDYCAAEDLMVLGWIHTHPTQTCFMSSRDLHTHCGYQIMMPESIAIVCAPSKTPS